MLATMKPHRRADPTRVARPFCTAPSGFLPSRCLMPFCRQRPEASNGTGRRWWLAASRGEGNAYCEAAAAPDGWAKARSGSMQQCRSEKSLDRAGVDNPHGIMLAVRTRNS